MLIGWIAAVLSAVSLIPQAIKSFKTKKAKDVSFLTFFVITLANFLWLIYGAYLNNWPLAVTNFIQVIFGIWILHLTIKHGK